MKALYKSIFFSVALVCGMTSCNKDEIPPTGGLDHAEQLVKGTYVGEWTRETVGTEDVISGPGSITFSVDPDYSNNVSRITVESSEIDIAIDDPKTSVCNITILSSGDFTYWNQTASNPFGATFYGTVDTDGVATMTYTKFVKEGRREYEFKYSFTGVKQ